MDANVAKLGTPAECDQFAANVAEKHPELAVQARRRGVELRAQQGGATSDAEREALEAVYAYEAVRSDPVGKRFRATRTWNMIKRRGIIGAVERAVDRDADPTGYKALAAANMKDKSFEAVVLRHPSIFTAAVVERCRTRLEKYESA